MAIALVYAHSAEFGSTLVRGRAEAPAELWMLSEGWGVLHSTDAGESWGWICEEAIGTEAVYDVQAWADNTAILGTREGMVMIDGSCVVTPYTGLDGGFVLRAERWQDKAVALWVGDGVGGVFTCDAFDCVATPLYGDGYFPKTAFVDGDTLYVTVVHTESLAAELYATTDGLTWDPLYRWPLGDTDPRLLWASGDTMYLWTKPRTDASLPAFLRSTDGGRSFEATFETGYYTDAAPGALVRDGGKTVLVGSYYGARTWKSTDGGQSFEERSPDLPSVRCGLDLDGTSYACGDHLADGFDLAVSTDGENFTPRSCIEEALPAECAEPACGVYVDAWVNAGAYGGGQCDVEEDTGRAPPPPGDECGCESGSASLLLLLAYRRRSAPAGGAGIGLGRG
ncbi:MAG: hypothetical protein FJ102_20290 [Deltaproteobacteria bacterium]|nr:hypothetical protein [Deltaproteobacteria bacterium]